MVIAIMSRKLKSGYYKINASNAYKRPGRVRGCLVTILKIIAVVIIILLLGYLRQTGIFWPLF